MVAIVKWHRINRNTTRAEVLGSERLTGATLDRLTHRCQIIEAKGESYRLRDAKGRRRTTKEDKPLARTEGPEAD